MYYCNTLYLFKVSCHSKPAEKLVKTFSENIIEKFKSIEANADKNQIELIACINNIIRPII